MPFAGLAAIVVGTTTITGGTASGMLWSNAGVIASGPVTTDTSGNITMPATTTLTFSGRSKLSSPSDGAFLVTNNAATGFTWLYLGGTTSSFPAFKVSGAT